MLSYRYGLRITSLNNSYPASRDNVNLIMFQNIVFTGRKCAYYAQNIKMHVALLYD